MHLVPIDLSHQTLLSDLFKKMNLMISEYSFANLYLFRKIHHYQLFYKQELFIKGITRDGSSYLMPTFPFTKSTSTEQVEHWLEEVDFLFPIPEQWIKYLNPNHLEFSYSEDDSDYLFTVDKMRFYPGRELSNKRNLVKQLLSEHEVNIVPFEKNHISEALKITQRWSEQQDSSEETTADLDSCIEALENMNILLLDGLMCYVDGIPSGFLLGETLAETSYVIHFLKANKEIKGLYQYLYQALADYLGNNYEFINLEQDMGNPGIHQAKHSYHPDLMLHKWKVSLKK